MAKLSYSEICDLIEQRSDDDADALTEEVLTKADRGALRTIVRAFVSHEQRNHAKASERRVFTPIRQAMRRQTKGSAAAAQTIQRNDDGRKQWLKHFRQIRDEQVALGNGEKRRWGAMTIEEHMTRIRMFREQIDGFERTISIHEQAIDLIRQNGAACLDEVVSTSVERSSAELSAGVAG